MSFLSLAEGFVGPASVRVPGIAKRYLRTMQCASRTLLYFKNKSLIEMQRLMRTPSNPSRFGAALHRRVLVRLDAGFSIVYLLNTYLALQLLRYLARVAVCACKRLRDVMRGFDVCEAVEIACRVA